MHRSATAVWEGSLKDGQGSVSSQSNTLNDTLYSFKSRFETGSGTNPEELIAAAHADCFSMMLAHLLDEVHLEAKSIETRAEITLDTDSGAILTSHLHLKANIPNITHDQFIAAAENAKKNCPVSRLLKANIKLDYELINH